MLSAFLLMLAGCQKSTDLDYGYYADWKINSLNRSWESKSVTVQTDGYFSCTKDTSIQVFFASLPIHLGKYHIVSESKAAAHTLAANEIAVEYNVGLNEVYLSVDGTDSVSIVVTDLGFYHLYVPESKVVHLNNGSSLDTTLASGNLSVPQPK